MSIILEGPDNAGKSTLATFLAKQLSLPIKHSGGPSKYLGEINERARIFNDDERFFIYDRHPCVSQNVYVEALGKGGELVDTSHLAKFNAAGHIVIYCRPVKANLDGHRMSEHSSEEYFREVERNYLRLLKIYDGWALMYATLVYRIGDDMNRVADMCNATMARREWR